MINIGLFEKIFGNKKQISVANYFKTFSAYTPVFTTYDGGVYEMELTRAAVHSFATACSKLKPEITGTAYKNLEKTLQFKPNPFMNTSQFIYRIATILSVCNNAFIVPVEDEYGYICGYYPLMPQNCEVMDVGGIAYLRYTFANGQRAVIELSKTGILTQFQYRNDFFGEDNSALNPTMQLIHTQNQGIINGVKSSANIRFMAKLANFTADEDIKIERKRFTEENLSADNNSGMIIFDNKYSDFKQVDSKPFVVNPAQMKLINENVYNYFGVNEGILQNKYTEDEWNAFYEGKIEPFAIQLSLAMSNMTYTPREISFDNKITFSANRLQYASNNTKLSISTQLFDRGLLNPNGVMEIWNRPPVEGGDKYYRRKEYGEVNQPNNVRSANADQNVPAMSDGTELINNVQDASKIAEVSLNGAQVQGLLSIVEAVTKKTLSYDAAVVLITSAFPFSEETAKKILQDAQKLNKGDDTNANMP